MTSEKHLRNWKILNDDFDETEVNNLCQALSILPTTAKLLISRGCKTEDDARSFLYCGIEKLHSPFLLPDMDLAADRIITALENEEKITIYGDYDVDGITSVATLYRYLTGKGGRVGYYIPSRFTDGYGVNEAAIEKIAGEGTSLIVTVDTGITAFEELKLAKSLGMDVVVTDHHECPEKLPECIAVVNPKRSDSQYPFDGLAGVGVAFKLICAIEEKLSGDDCASDMLDKYSDFVSIGTIADVMPLLDENRAIVKIGLKCIESNPCYGIRALLEKAGITEGKKIDANTISFNIAPRLNAAGRLGDACEALKLLLAPNQHAANALAINLCETNTKRQNLEHEIAKQAIESIEKEHNLKEESILVVAHENWHNGIIGIVASRVSEKYHLPSILITLDGEEGKGSGRSIKGFNLVQALSENSGYLKKFGGHELAAGLSITKDNVIPFSRAINEYAKNHVPKAEEDFTEIEFELDSYDITMRQANELAMLEPFGIGNSSPIFLIKNATISEITPIGNGKHTKFAINLPYLSESIGAVMFGCSPKQLDIRYGDKADIIFNLSINEFLGKASVQLLIKDITPTTETVEKYENENREYLSVILGEAIDGGKYLPTKDEFAAAYRYIKNAVSSSDGYISLKQISDGSGLNDNIKTKIILDIFTESGLVSIKEENSVFRLYKIKMIPQKQKVNLEDSETYKKLV